MSNLGLVGNTGTTINGASLLDQLGSRRGLGNKGEGTVSVNSDDYRDDEANVSLGAFVEFLGETHDVNAMLGKGRTNRGGRSGLTCGDL